MAIAEMSALSLVALLSDKDKVYDALVATGAAQIKTQEEREQTVPLAAKDTAELRQKIDRAKKCLEFLADEIETLPKTERGEGLIKDGFAVATSEFMTAGERSGEVEKTLDEIDGLSAEKNSLRARSAKVNEQIKSYEPYVGLKLKFSEVSDTKTVKVYLGTVTSDKIDKCLSELGEIECCEAFAECDGKDGTVLSVAVYRKQSEEVEKVLSACGFTKCQFAGDFTATEKIGELNAELKEIDEGFLSVAKRAAKLAEQSREVKVYVDYLGYLIEKADADGTLYATMETFVMEAFVPTEKVEEVKAAIEKATRACEIETKVVPRDEFAPTLMKNKSAVANFEAVTNMYSVPAYGALDPNAVMSFFFSLFMGLIMADFGYGILMIVGGFLFAAKQREGTTLYRMAKVFAYGGFFACIFGALFDSWLGYPLLRTIFGEGSEYCAFYAEYLDAINSPANIAGITVPQMLLWCLGLGAVQIAVSLIMKTVQCFSRKQYFEGIFSGAVWAIGLLAFVVAVFGMASDNAFLTKYGAYIAIGLIALGILTSGVTEKGIGKIIKPFSSVYGLINYASDILSYARLYGLMLSGAQIASIFTNNLAIELLFPQGVIGVIFGVVIIIIGNVFNLAMSLLGAFIHDSRLQYVEFFGRFYEGEGELFTPLGHSGEYTYFVS